MTGERKWHQGRAGLLAVLACAMLIVLPTVSMNALRSADATFFDGWDRESQALVLARVEQARADTAPVWGLTRAEPDIYSTYATFDQDPAPPPAPATPYESQLGLQGIGFSALDAAGCSSLGCLTGTSAVLFSLTLLAFLGVLAALTRRSVAGVVLVVALLSPWVVASARNLYWVPWTWLLPAVAAGVLVLARTPRRRRMAAAALLVTVALKAGSGYEFITTVVLLAAAMPVLAAAFGRLAPRRAARDCLTIAAVSAGAVTVVLLAHALVAGQGSLIEGAQAVIADASRRTWGAARPGLDAGTVESLRVDPLTVLKMYTVGWQTDLLGAGVGTRFAIGLGRWGFAAVVVAALVAVLLSVLRRRARWRSDLVVLVAAAVPPLSWFVLAKSHAYSAVGMSYVLWYWLLVPVALWVVGSTAASLVVPALSARRRAVLA